MTWTDLYTTVFGPTGTSSCNKTGGCHITTQSGFKCGTTKTSCYNGLVAVGMINPGPHASASKLVDPNQSPLCGSLGGGMPKFGTCINAAELADLKSWLASGAADD